MYEDRREKKKNFIRQKEENETFEHRKNAKSFEKRREEGKKKPSTYPHFLSYSYIHVHILCTASHGITQHTEIKKKKNKKRHTKNHTSVQLASSTDSLFLLCPPQSLPCLMMIITSGLITYSTISNVHGVVVIRVVNRSFEGNRNYDPTQGLGTEERVARLVGTRSMVVTRIVKQGN